MRYYTSDSEPDAYASPFPRLDVKLRLLEKQYEEAEFDGDDNLCNSLLPKIKSVKFSLSLGEEYDVPF